MSTPAVTPDTISRYLSDRLSEREREDFEGLCARRPEIVRDLEETLRFREGLAVLRDRGALTNLLQLEGRRRPVVAWALAAALAGVAVATVLWLRAPHPQAQVLAAVPVAAQGRGQVYSFVTIRGRAEAVSIATGDETRPSEFRLLPDTLSPTSRYWVALEQLTPDGHSVAIGRLEHLAAGSDGFVVVYASLAGRAGRHRLSIGAEPASAAGVATRFEVDLVGAAPLRAPAK